MSSSSNNQQPATGTWTEPPWSGWIETTGDALLILEAARRGLIPRVTRRLVDSERKMITSGSVFVFDEDESGIKRWTDGFFWSPSRILGNFLLYRETDKRGAGHRGARGESTLTDVNDQSQYAVDGSKQESHSLSRPKGEPSALDKHRERTLYGSLTNSYKFKPDGLMKKTFSLTIRGASQHLISYYKIEDVESGRLRPPSSLPELASLDISPEYLDKTHFRNPPKVEIGLDGVPRYRGEADDIDTGPSLLSGPLSTGLPLMSDPSTSDVLAGAGKRPKRYDPYAGQKQKSRRNTKSGTGPDGPDAASPSAVDQQQQPLAPSTPISPASTPGVGGMQHAHSYPHSSPTGMHQHYHDPAAPGYHPPAHVPPPPPPPPHYAPYGHMPSYYQVSGYVYPPPAPHQYSYSGYPAQAIIPTPGPGAMSEIPSSQPPNNQPAQQQPLSQAPPHQAQVITTYQHPSAPQGPGPAPGHAPPPAAQSYSYYYPPPYSYPAWSAYPPSAAPNGAPNSSGVPVPAPPAPAVPPNDGGGPMQPASGYGQPPSTSDGAPNPSSSGTSGPMESDDVRAGGGGSGGDDSD